MNRTASIFSLLAALSLLLCACGDQNHATVDGLTPSQAQHLQSNHATFTTAKEPPLNADTHFAAGQLAETQGNFDVAITQYQAALGIDAHHVPSLFRLGVLYVELRQFDKAIPIWQRYVDASHQSANSYGNLGFCYEAANRAAEAQAAYLKGIDKDSRNLLCRTNYGLMLARQGRVPEAMAIWQPVLSPAEIHYNLGSLDELNGRKDQARMEYQKALGLDPKFSDAKSRLAGL